MAEQEQTVDQQQEKAREKAEDDRYQRAEQQPTESPGLLSEAAFPAVY